VVAAAVILPKDSLIFGVRDSKELEEKRRESIFGEIGKRAIDSVESVKIEFILYDSHIGFTDKANGVISFNRIEKENEHRSLLF
jgi:ribonuclease HII